MREDINQAAREALAAAGEPLSSDEIVAIISELLGDFRSDFQHERDKVHSEIANLLRYIQNAKQEIAQLRGDDWRGTKIPNATDELDAVVGATETATGQILDAAEAVQNLANNCDVETRAALIGHVTQIFEACNFQDITGQRITKVIKLLRTLEERIAQLIAALDDGAESGIAPVAPVEAAPLSAAERDKELLNGPQLDGQGISQDDIDKLFA